LLKPAAFTRVFREGKRSADSHLVVLFAAQMFETARLGMAVSKKVARRAVDRNRLRRLMRESFRLNRPNLPDVDIVIMARPSIGALSNQEIRQRLDQHWARVKRQCAES
jgi:ribonuclease P protein component